MEARKDVSMENGSGERWIHRKGSSKAVVCKSMETTVVNIPFAGVLGIPGGHNVAAASAMLPGACRHRWDALPYQNYLCILAQKLFTQKGSQTDPQGHIAAVEKSAQGQAGELNKYGGFILSQVGGNHLLAVRVLLPVWGCGCCPCISWVFVWHVWRGEILLMHSSYVHF